jgi:hypothetical protein
LVIGLGTAGGGSAFFYGTIMTTYNPRDNMITIDPARDYDWNVPNIMKVCPRCVYARNTPFWKDAGVINFYDKPFADMVSVVRQRIVE